MGKEIGKTLFQFRRHIAWEARWKRVELLFRHRPFVRRLAFRGTKGIRFLHITRKKNHIPPLVSHRRGCNVQSRSEAQTGRGKRATRRKDIGAPELHDAKSSGLGKAISYQGEVQRRERRRGLRVHRKLQECRIRSAGQGRSSPSHPRDEAESTLAARSGGQREKYQRDAWRDQGHRIHRSVIPALFRSQNKGDQIGEYARSARSALTFRAYDEKRGRCSREMLSPIQDHRAQAAAAQQRSNSHDSGGGPGPRYTRQEGRSEQTTLRCQRKFQDRAFELPADGFRTVRHTLQGERT